ncbi:hypothetical protein ACHAWO_009556 [Cyclotella atomus]|uniref:Uncharacterized protein n=1 Tax=Cyclotella atomus TaxID=382360 RepID=A0ABD3N6R7_9STRA
MPTMASSPLSPEPSSVVARFWSSLRSSAHEEATEVARRVLLEQAPVTEAFSFDMVDEEGQIGGGQPRESPLAAVEAGTPRPVVQSWNQDKLVSLVFIRRDYICGAAIGNDVTPAAVDFKACLLPREGAENMKCNAGTHLGPRVKRMNPPTMDYLVAIAVPGSSDVPKQVFSRPVLQQADLFHLPLESEAYSKLMVLKLEPRVWKLLFELFPGPHCLAEPLEFAETEATSLPEHSVPTSVQPAADRDLQEVTRAPIFTPRQRGNRPGDPYQTPTSRASEVASPSGSQLVPAVVHGDGGSQSQQSWSQFTSRVSRPPSSVSSSAGSQSTLFRADTQADEDLQEAVRGLINRVESLEAQKAQQEAMDKELWRKLQKNFKKVAEENSKLNKDLKRAKEQIKDLTAQTRHCHSDASLSQGIDDHTFQQLLGRLTVSMGSTFVSRSDLQSSVHAPSPVYIARLEALEREVLNHGGSLPSLLVRVDALEAARSATAIEIAGHVFVDEAATEAWARTFADPNLHRFCVDFVSFFLLAEPRFESVEGGLEQMAAVVKAKYMSRDLATIELSYSIVYPSRILKSSDKADAQLTDGIIWASQFATFETFEGDYNNGTHLRLKRSLNQVAKAIENGIDYHFPIASRPLANAVFKEQARVSLTQCIEFLDSISPLYKNIQGSGMSDKDAWQRVLVFAKQLFVDVATVRAPNSESSMGSMIWSSFRTAELLKEYQRHNWVEHPKTSSILALTSMRKEGRAIEELASKFNTQLASVNRHTTELKRLGDDLKELRKKNPSLN